MKHYSTILGTLVASCFLFACTQKEEEISVSSVTISQPTAEMIVGETVKLFATISPSNATDKDVIWASSKQSVATIDRSGLVTAIAEGTSNITATAGSKTGTCLITVSKKIIEVSSIELNKTELSLIEEQEFTLVATVKPEDATDKSVTWTSSDSSVAAVENGKVTAIKEGTTSITAKAGNKSVSCIVSVSKKVIAVTEVILDNTSLSMVEDDEITLAATVKPDDATDRTITWNSSNTAIAKVDNGKVIAIKEGVAIITAKAGDKSATCSVTVQKKVIAVTSIALNKATLSLTKGQSETLVATVKPDNATDKNVTWTTTNSSVASVENGKITAVGGGSAIITAKVGDKEASCSVTVTVTVPITSITLSKSFLSMVEDDEITLAATVKPDDATDRTITWSSDKTDVATVDNNGQIKAIKEGNATITAKVGDKNATCQITVSKKTIPVESISLDRYTVTLLEGESTKLIATVSPSSATDKAVSWTSSNTAIAAVSQDGTVSAKQEGEATITATAGNKTAKCVVTVSKKVVPVSSIALNKTSLSLNKGQTETLIATVSPTDATDKTVSWSSSDATIASVDQLGKVSAIKGGSAIITAAAGEKFVTCTVTITVPVQSVSLDKSSLSLKKGESTKITATISPNDATEQTIIWTSSNSSAVTVQQDGMVTAVKSGNAEITASVGGKSAACSVFVTTPVESVSIDKNSISLEEGQTTSLVATITPSDADEKTVTWTSSNSSIATVGGAGVVKAICEGQAVIMATVGGKSATCTVTVSKKVVPVTSVSLSESSISLNKGESTTLIATISPSNATIQTVTWSSSNTNVASVNQSGEVTATGGGDAIITASVDGKSATCAVTVSVQVTGVSLNLGSTSIGVNETVELVATISPSDATNKSVQWASSNNRIATVNNGIVTGLRSGVANIIASANSKEAVCVVTVTAPAVAFKDAKLKAYLVSVYDNNNDGEIDVSEALDIESISCQGRSISDLTGLEYCTNLVYLNVAGNNLSVIEIPNLQKLKSLVAYNNPIERINIKNDAALNELYLLGANTNAINGTTIALDGFDLSPNLSISFNGTNYTSLSITNSSLLKNINVSENAHLINLVASGTQITSLDITNLTHLQVLNINSCCINTLDLSNNPVLVSLNCASNQLSSLTLSNNTKLRSLDCSNNDLSFLRVSDNPLLESALLSNNKIGAINTSYNPYLKVLDISENPDLSVVSLSSNTAIESINASKTSISSIDISSNPSLKNLILADCLNIYNLDLSSGTNLEDIDISGTSIVKIDVSNSPHLKKLNVSNNSKMYSLDYVEGVSIIAGYELGRSLKVNGVSGVVFYSNYNGTITKIVSLDETTKTWGYLGTSYPNTNYGDQTGATSKDNGLSNTSRIKSGSPAAEWCVKKGERWYLPAVNELINLLQNKDTLSKALVQAGGTGFTSTSSYWSSTEEKWIYKNSSGTTWTYFLTYIVYASDTESNLHNRENSYRVRAVRAL